MKGLSKIYSPQ